MPTQTNPTVTAAEPVEIDLESLGNPAFLALLDETRKTHLAKAAGYSGSDNPDTWSNFREATAWGLTPLEGCLVRMGDKYRRVQNLRRNAANDQVGESIRDTLMDLANYALIAVCLMQEEAEAAKPKGEWPIKDSRGIAKNAHEVFDPARGGKIGPSHEAHMGGQIETFDTAKHPRGVDSVTGLCPAASGQTLLHHPVWTVAQGKGVVFCSRCLKDLPDATSATQVPMGDQ